MTVTLAALAAGLLLIGLCGLVGLLTDRTAPGCRVVIVDGRWRWKKGVVRDVTYQSVLIDLDGGEIAVCGADDVCPTG
jgi:hypothetical protein